MSPSAAGSSVRVPFADFGSAYAARRKEIDAAVARVIASGSFILGPEVEAFEGAFSRFLGVDHVIGCGNGTDAIALMLLAAGAGPDDEVVVPANACVPVAAGVRLSGARLRLADVDAGTLTLDPEAVDRAAGPRTRFVLAVHLYGGVADLDGLQAVAERRGLTLLEDCAQSHGAAWKGCRTGSFGAAAAFSFYPTKNLGAFGDGGAVATRDPEIARRLRSLRQYGWSRRDFAETEGRNSRLDELQAAILGAKLPALEEDNARRRAVAAFYDEALADLPLTLLSTRPGSVSAAHLYPVRSGRRDAVRETLEGAGVETGIHYPTPLHLQPAYAFLGHRRGDFPVSEQAAETVLSLPLHPRLTGPQVEAVVSGIRGFFGAA
ncbi:MAG: DegT/DnrJ/EryC1/StrS family aminotransferase [Acidobacteria bacterium]|nr:DegT/DnrJ/EryC1/StrS family aminotransferase [Acidobacteriota bacterium]